MDFARLPNAFLRVVFAHYIWMLAHRMITLYSRKYFVYYTRAEILYVRGMLLHRGAVYVPRTRTRERRSSRSFRIGRDPARGCISEKMCRVMRRGPETRMTGERPMRWRTTYGVGRKIGRCDFPAAEEEAAAPRYAPSRIVLLALYAVIVWAYDCAFRTRYRLDRLFSLSPIPRFQLAVNIGRSKNMTGIGIL